MATANVTVTYNGSNILNAVSMTTPVSITYNGSTIASMSAGTTKTLNCNGKYMNTNVVVGTKALNCANKIMSSNIGISVAIAGDVDYLCFTANSANSKVTLSITGTLTGSPVLYYSTNKSTWTQYAFGTEISLSTAGSKVYFKGTNSTFSKDLSNFLKFTFSRSVAASGNIMTLLDETGVSTTIPTTYCFAKMFDGASSLTSAPSLPATTLKNYCYQHMFRNCNNLIVAPSLPATTLAQYCYSNMFAGCTSLNTPPNLPAISLSRQCYYAMFSGCTSLSINTSGTYPWRIPTSGTGTTATNALTNMLSSTGGNVKGTPSINTTYYCDYNPV